MSIRTLPSLRLNTICALLLFATNVNVVFAQQATHRWSGIAADEARSASGPMQFDPSAGPLLAPEAMSADARFVVFVSRLSLVRSDTNENWDVYLRDRHTGELRRISVAFDGLDPNGVSSWPTISSDGRHVAFSSCATNLVPGDDNNLCDVFVHDLALSTTTRVNLGPEGEQSVVVDSGYVRLSANGRYALFTSLIGEAPQAQLWLRDRDPDQNGIYDEPTHTAMIEIPPAVVPDVQLFGFNEFALSADARFIAYSPHAYTLDYQYLGSRMFLYDRMTGMTVQVGDAPVDSGLVIEYLDPDFGGAEYLAYTTNAPNLLPGDDDFDVDQDVFVLNLLTGGHERLRLTHEAAPLLREARYPSISADGRYVSFVGIDAEPQSYTLANVYAVDRQLGASHDVSVRPDGVRVDRVGAYPSISDDGTAIAFVAGQETLVESWGSDGVFVATALTLSPFEVTIPAAGGTASIDVSLQTPIAWNVTTVDLSTQGGLLQVTPEGVGSGTIDVALPDNYTTDDREYRVIVGSEYVTVRQPASPIVWWVDPSWGPLTGGTELSIFGNGFRSDAIVTLGGQPMAAVVVENSSYIRAITPARGGSGSVDLVIRNANGESAVFENAFTYFDDSPPAITATVTGTQGLNGWYTSDVSVQWTVQDEESPLQFQECESTVIDYDTTERHVTCVAASEGGTASQELILKRDAVPPSVNISTPQERTYKRGEIATISYSCSDGTSGVSSCTGPVPVGTPLDTNTVGRFTFTVVGVDHAGLRTTATVAYSIKAMPVINWPAPANITYGTALNVAQLNATSDVAGTFTYSPAAGTVLPAGMHTLSVTFTPAEAGSYFTAYATTTIVVQPAPLSIMAHNAAKVYGEALPQFTASATEFVNGDSLSSLTGALTLQTPATATSAPGAYPIVPGGVSSTNYRIQFVAGTLSVTQAATSMVLTSTPNPARPRQDVVMHAAVSVLIPGGGIPTGVVEFRENGVLLGAAQLVNGVATLTIDFKRGTHTLTASYIGDQNFTGSAAVLTQVAR